MLMHRFSVWFVCSFNCLFCCCQNKVVVADWKVWPLYDVVCFTYVPQHVRGTTTVAVNCLWGCYISFMANRPVSAAVAH